MEEEGGFWCQRLGSLVCFLPPVEQNREVDHILVCLTLICLNVHIQYIVL